MARRSKARRKQRMLRVNISRLHVPRRIWSATPPRELIALGAVFIFGLIVLILFIWLIHGLFFGIRISVKDVQAMRIPSNEITQIYEICALQQKDHIAALTTYLLDNRFFKEKQTAKTTEQLQMDFFPKMGAIKKRIPNKQFDRYYALIETIMTELKCFPLLYDGGAGAYMFGDTWSTKRAMCGTSNHAGCDVFDRENIPGRMLIVSMTNGTVEDTGKNGRGGTFVSIRTEKGSIYIYDNLDRTFDSLETGTAVIPGTPLGYMGNGGKSENVKGKSPANVHIGMKIKTSVGKSEMWINPYPFLRFLEDKMLAENVV